MVHSKIKGINFTQLKEISDERGSVLHMLRSDSQEFEKFGECYFSEILPGKIKAWKCHSIQTQNLAVPIGLIKIVLFDPREKSKTKGLLEEYIIGRPNNYYRLKIPPKIWYGFTCVSKEKALIVNCANIPHSPDESKIYPINNLPIPYKWDA
jgi:dTDP-4-dehydrorhamnose 3,5-epimerase